MSPENAKRLDDLLDDAAIRDGTRQCPECKRDMRSADADWLCPCCYLRVPKKRNDFDPTPEASPDDPVVVISQGATPTCNNTGHKFSHCDCPPEAEVIPIGTHVRDLTPEEVGAADDGKFIADVRQGSAAATLTPTQTTDEQVEAALTPPPACPACVNGVLVQVLDRRHHFLCRQCSRKFTKRELYLWKKGGLIDVDDAETRRAALMAEHARQTGVWPPELTLKPGCPCPCCNWGHLSFDVSDKSLRCVYGLRPGCGAHVSNRLLATLKLQDPVSVVRALIVSLMEPLTLEQMRARRPVLRLSHAMGAAFEAQLDAIKAPPIPIQGAIMPTSALVLGYEERFLCNFDGVSIIQRRKEKVPPRPERRQAPRYEAHPGDFYRDKRLRQAGMATLNELAELLAGEGLNVGELRLTPDACRAVRDALQQQAKQPALCLSEVKVPVELHVGSWFVQLLGGEDKFGMTPAETTAWQEERDRRNAVAQRQIQALMEDVFAGSPASRAAGITR